MIPMEEHCILTIDAGNTATKFSLFSGESLIVSEAVRGDSLRLARKMFASRRVGGVCICRVGEVPSDLEQWLSRCGVPVVEVGPEVALPLDVSGYARESLGADRIAAAAGAACADRPVMVVDAGTAVTADIVAGSRFAGGNISPGLGLRFRALNAYTSRLPLVKTDGPLPEFGHDTESAIRAGVVRGLVAEIVAGFRSAAAEYKNIKMILTGGDSDFLYPLIAGHTVDVELDHSVVGRGLVRIFNYNNNIW